MTDSVQPAITTLVPHRKPMLLLDEVVERDGLRVVCRTTIRSDMVFVEDGRMPLAVAIELFAQCAAVLTSLLATKAGIRIDSGALLGTREIRLLADDLKVGDVLDVHCEQTMSMGMMAHVDCALYRAGERIAEGSVHVMAGAPP
ncbi:MAG: hypothetical protein AB7S26_17285 [Sandaracinaceae bacterium]